MLSMPISTYVSTYELCASEGVDFYLCGGIYVF